MKRLILFDIDGTLCNTVAIDDLCMQRALTEVFAFPVDSIAPFCGDNGTDTGVTREAFRLLQRKKATSGDIERVRLSFLRHLESAQRTSPDAFLPIPGAEEAFRSIVAHQNWKAGLASGAWWQSAELKLRGMGIDPELFPGAFAEDSHSREVIISTAIERASHRYHTLSWDKIVYVGDGLWDLRAARRLRIGFVGIARNERRNALLKEGAMTVLNDFTNLPVLHSALEVAAVPAWISSLVPTGISD